MPDQTAHMEASNDQKAKSSKLRRRRGYRWEDSLVKRLNDAGGWRAFRLGSPSVALPDVLAVNIENRAMLIMEAKSGAKTSLSVPPNQIQRCLDWRDTFDIYDTRTVVLAFKFLSKKRLSSGAYVSRTIREYYKIWDPTVEPMECICTYDGEIFTIVDGSRRSIELYDYSMPWL